MEELAMAHLNYVDTSNLTDAIHVDLEPTSIPCPKLEEEEEIVVEDARLNPRYFSTLPCKICRQHGHLTIECTSRQSGCYLCHQEHDPLRCSLQAICFQCFRRGHQKDNCPDSGSRKECEYCDVTGHSTMECTAMWRRYLYRENNHPETVFAYCYHCGDQGHFGDDCKRRSSYRRDTAFNWDAAEIHRPKRRKSSNESHSHGSSPGPGSFLSKDAPPPSSKKSNGTPHSSKKTNGSKEQPKSTGKYDKKSKDSSKPHDSSNGKNGSSSNGNKAKPSKKSPSKQADTPMFSQQTPRELNSESLNSKGAFANKDILSSAYFMHKEDQELTKSDYPSSSSFKPRYKGGYA